MMLSRLYVSKCYGTYADTCLMLGLACLANYALTATQLEQPIQLRNRATYYEIDWAIALDLESLRKIDYIDLFPPVVGAKTDRSKIPPTTVPFETVEQTETRKLYREVHFIQREENIAEVSPPDPRTQNGVMLTSMRHDRNHNSLWEESWNLRQNFGDLVAAIFTVFSDRQVLVNPSIENAIAKEFNKATNKKLPKPASAIKLFMPTSIQGINRLKADGIGSGSQKESWVILWLIAKGLFEFALSERVKVGERTFDWRTVLLEPKNITLDRYRNVLDRLRQFNPPGSGHGIARFDAELVLKFNQTLLNYHPTVMSATSRRLVREQTKKSRKLLRKQTKTEVSSFRGAHFVSKGQVYGLKNIFSLGLPNWIKPTTTREAIEYHKVLQEHLTVVRSLNEYEPEILAAYRDFVTGNHLQLFFQFQVLYADNALKKLADPKSKNPGLFSTTGLNIMVKNLNPKPADIAEVIENSGFLRIARAINSATVYAGAIHTKNGSIDLDWQKTYGLAQRLNSHTDSPKDFTIELTRFLTEYENENLRITDKGKQLKRVWPTKEDLDNVIKLIYDPRFGCSLVANLLIVYGYSKWTQALKNEDNVTENNQTEQGE